MKTYIQQNFYLKKVKKKKKKNRCKFPFFQKITNMLKVTKRQSLSPP